MAVNPVIGIDARSLFPGMGGIGRYVEMLIGRLPSLADNIRFHIFATEKCAGGVPKADHVRDHRHACAMIDPRWEQLDLPGLLAGIGADLYHGTCFSLPVARGAKRLVVTVHDVIFRRHPELVDPSLREFLDRWTAVALEIADRVITVSEFSRLSPDN